MAVSYVGIDVQFHGLDDRNKFSFRINSLADMDTLANDIRRLLIDKYGQPNMDTDLIVEVIEHAGEFDG